MTGRKSSGRRGAIRQKPWNKVARTEKYWGLSQQLQVQQTDASAAMQGATAQIASGGQAKYIVYHDGPSLNGQQDGGGAASSVNIPFGHVKIHRFQGDILVWMPQDHPDPAPISEFTEREDGTDGTKPLPNAAMVTYAWMKLDEVASTPVGGGVYPAANMNPRPDQFLSNLLTRDDIIKWGTVLVRGINPMMRNLIQSAEITAGGAQQQALGFHMGNPGQWEAGGVARIPFPRIPKFGLNLGKGEALVCVAAAWPGPMGNNGADIFDWPADYPEGEGPPINFLQLYRVLCSN